jgi:peptidoglycan/LPS O-acetylase OafA/YrhL
MGCICDSAICTPLSLVRRYHFGHGDHFRHLAHPDSIRIVFQSIIGAPAPFAAGMGVRSELELPSWSISTEMEAYIYFVFFAGVLLQGRRPYLMFAICIFALIVLCVAQDGSLNDFFTASCPC